MLQFDQISKLRSKDFDKKDFLKLYLDNTGFNYSYEERQKRHMEYWFVYIITMP